MSDPLRLILQLAIVAAVALAQHGCTPTTDNPTASLSKDVSTDTEDATDALSFRKLEEDYQDVIRAFPLKMQSGTVLERLVDAALREKMAGDRDALMRRMPEHNVGLYLFEQKYSETFSNSAESAFSFAADIQEEFAGTRLALIAFDKWLLQLQADDGAAFLQVCVECLSESHERHADRIPIVLVRRAEYHYATGNFKECAKDYLQFWSMHPQMVAELGMELRILGRLKDAGLFWESTNLEVSTEPAKFAGKLFEEFRNVDAASVEPTESLSEIYWRHTPEIASLSIRTVETTLEGIRFLDRIGSLAMFAGEAETSRELYRECGKKLLELHSMQQERVEDSQRLREYFQFAYQNILRLFSNYLVKELVEVEYVFDTKTDSELVIDLTRMEYRLTVSDDSVVGDKMSADLSAAEKFAGLATKLNDKEAVVEVYKDIIARYADTSVGPEYLLKIGDLYRDSWDAPAKAMDTYASLRESYPDSPLAESAVSRIALSQFDLESYQDAYLTAQEYMALFPTGAALVGMKMVSALCESALGQSIEAEIHMLEIVEEHRLSPLAPQALFWVASNKLASQDYDVARSTFQELLDRYPDSQFSERARDYLKRLDSVPN